MAMPIRKYHLPIPPEIPLNHKLMLWIYGEINNQKEKLYLGKNMF